MTCSCSSVFATADEDGSADGGGRLESSPRFNAASEASQRELVLVLVCKRRIKLLKYPRKNTKNATFPATEPKSRSSLQFLDWPEREAQAGAAEARRRHGDGDSDVDVFKKSAAVQTAESIQRFVIYLYLTS